MAGIIFFRTTMLRDIVDFYLNEMGMHIWLEQAECVILNHGNLLLGFCEGDVAETEGMITLFYPEKEDVDVKYNQLKQISTSEPRKNDKYQIYQFFAEDPEGRALEFQAFLHPIEPVGFF
ncbi:VOC family protein [Candidatus Thorarchaeota archaeon]|nr:MAG: VOC family protein [Candidatus Thorarchaeota archaeon]